MKAQKTQTTFWKCMGLETCVIIVSRIIQVKVDRRLNVTNKFKYQRRLSSRLAIVMFRGTPCMFHETPCTSREFIKDWFTYVNNINHHSYKRKNLKHTLAYSFSTSTVIIRQPKNRKTTLQQDLSVFEVVRSK